MQVNQKGRSTETQVVSLACETTLASRRIGLAAQLTRLSRSADEDSSKQAHPDGPETQPTSELLARVATHLAGLSADEGFASEPVLASELLARVSDGLTGSPYPSPVTFGQPGSPARRSAWVSTSSRPSRLRLESSPAFRCSETPRVLVLRYASETLCSPWNTAVCLQIALNYFKCSDSLVVSLWCSLICACFVFPGLPDFMFPSIIFQSCVLYGRHGVNSGPNGSWESGRYLTMSVCTPATMSFSQHQ